MELHSSTVYFAVLSFVFSLVIIKIAVEADRQSQSYRPVVFSLIVALVVAFAIETYVY